jgi:hypothetical protein
MYVCQLPFGAKEVKRGSSVSKLLISVGNCQSIVMVVLPSHSLFITGIKDKEVSKQELDRHNISVPAL